VVLLKLNSNTDELFRVKVSSWLTLSGLVMFTRTVSTAMLSVMFAWMVTWLDTLKVVPLVGATMLTCGAKMLSCDTKKVLSVELMLFTLSFAKNVTLYCPVRFGMVKLVLNNVLTFVRLSCMMVPFGSVMLMDTLPAVVLMFTLSTMVAPISIVSETLKLAPLDGSKLVMFGARLSCIRKNPFSVELRLFEVSFAMIVKV